MAKKADLRYSEVDLGFKTGHSHRVRPHVSDLSCANTLRLMRIIGHVKNSGMGYKMPPHNYHGRTSHGVTNGRSAWSGDWKARIDDFAHSSKKLSNIFGDYLVAHPGVLNTGGGRGHYRRSPRKAVQIERINLASASDSRGRSLGELIRDMLARGIHRHLPHGWKTESDFQHAQAARPKSTSPFTLLHGSIRNGYSALLRTSPPRSGWLGARDSGDDELLNIGFCQEALTRTQ